MGNRPNKVAVGPPRALDRELSEAELIQLEAEIAKKEAELAKREMELAAREALLAQRLCGKPLKQLIISSGEISDVDGFYALAEYSKTGADVMFIMNYPAYVGVKDEHCDQNYANTHPGLGFKYSEKDFLRCQAQLRAAKTKTSGSRRGSNPLLYEEFVRSYDDGTSTGFMKRALTDLAHYMSNQVWCEGPPNRGALYFCIGGINTINPFHQTAIKDEVWVYVSAGAIPSPLKHLPTDEGLILNADGERVELDFAHYSDIYVDFSGSMAFLNEQWVTRLRHPSVVRKLKGAFIMGGVYADAPPATMPAAPNVLNRFSCATMNQLFAPGRSAAFFELLREHGIPAYAITNNAVQAITTTAAAAASAAVGGAGGGDAAATRGPAPVPLTSPDAEQRGETTDEAVRKFLTANGIGGAFLTRIALAHYNSIYRPPLKPFDYHTALALKADFILNVNADGWDAAPADASHYPAARGAAAALAADSSARRGQLLRAAALTASAKRLYYSGLYGVCLVSDRRTWREALADYAGRIDAADRPAGGGVEGGGGADDGGGGGGGGGGGADAAAAHEQRRQGFRREVAALEAMGELPWVGVYDVRFVVDHETKRVDIDVDIDLVVEGLRRQGSFADLFGSADAA